MEPQPKDTPSGTPPGSAPRRPSDDPDRPSRSAAARRAAFEAQKQYMDGRFGRGRVTERKPPL